MARKRHKKRSNKTPLPAFKGQAHKYSTAAQILANQIAIGGIDDFKNNLISTLNDSAELAEEPEFTDLTLDIKRTFQVTDRGLKKFGPSLKTAEKKGPDAYQQALDEMRIEVIAELATPAFRKEVDSRLQALLDRLKVTKDPKKLEIVMVLIPALDLEVVPWGLCGLILAIYNRTMQQAIQEYKEQMSLYDSVVEALKSEGVDDTDIHTILEHPDKLEQIGQDLFESRPGLRQKAEKQVWAMVEAFEDQLMHGDVDLNLFTEEELLRPFQRIEAELGVPFTQIQPSTEISEKTFNAIRQAIIDIMTQERFRRFRDDVQRTAKIWSHEYHKWAAALQFELGYLEGDIYEENKFILAAFLGQINRVGKEQQPARETGDRR